MTPTIKWIINTNSTHVWFSTDHNYTWTDKFILHCVSSVYEHPVCYCYDRGLGIKGHVDILSRTSILSYTPGMIPPTFGCDY